MNSSPINLRRLLADPAARVSWAVRTTSWAVRFRSNAPALVLSQPSVSDPTAVARRPPLVLAPASAPWTESSGRDRARAASCRVPLWPTSLRAFNARPSPPPQVVVYLLPSPSSLTVIPEHPRRQCRCSPSLGLLKLFGVLPWLLLPIAKL